MNNILQSRLLHLSLRKTSLIGNATESCVSNRRFDRSVRFDLFRYGRTEQDIGNMKCWLKCKLRESNLKTDE